jgi:hypothetical protein
LHYYIKQSKLLTHLKKSRILKIPQINTTEPNKKQ